MFFSWLLSQIEALDQRFGEDAIDEIRDDDDEYRGCHEDILELSLERGDHGVGHCTPQSSNEDDNLPSEVDGFPPEAVDDVDHCGCDDSPCQHAGQ